MMNIENLGDKEKLKCPYCMRKVNYGKRFIAKDKGEYLCQHCNKVSNVRHNRNVWLALIIAATVSLLFLLFYLTAYKGIQRIYDEEGKLGLLVALFFGDAIIFKWILWEILPFAAFYFLSPVFVEFYPQKRFMEQTQTKIDLSVPTSVSNTAKVKNSSQARNIPKANTHSFKGVYEDISSSSSGDIDKTRAFRVTDNEYSDINRERQVKSNSYRGDTPLVKVSREVSAVREEENMKEYIPQKDRINTQKPVNNPVQKPQSNSNYSANRKF